MLLPGIIYLIVNNYMPMAGLLLAFKKVNYSIGMFKSPWVAFANFKYLFHTNDAALFFRNTILYNLIPYPCTVHNGSFIIGLIYTDQGGVIQDGAVTEGHPQIYDD